MSGPVRIGIETSQRSGSIALLSEGELFEAQLEDGRKHASDLLPGLDRLCQEAGVPRGRDLKVDAVCVGLGPGSYTGLRVGIAFALGLLRGSRAEGVRALGVASGEIVSWADLAVGESGTLLLDARQGGLYFARYEREEKDVRVVQAPCVIEAKRWREVVPEEGRIFGDATVVKAAGLDEEVAARVVSCRAGARALLELAGERLGESAGVEWGELEPLYLRGFGESGFGGG